MSSNEIGSITDLMLSKKSIVNYVIVGSKIIIT